MHITLSPLHRRILCKMTALPRPMALMISMISPGLTYLCPLYRGAVSPSPRLSLFPCGSSPRAPLDGAVILAHTPGEEGRKGEGGLGQGDAGGALDGCRVRMGTRVYGWKHLRHVTSDFVLKGTPLVLLKRAPLFTGLLCSSVQGTGLCLCNASFPLTEKTEWQRQKWLLSLEGWRGGSGLNCNTLWRWTLTLK